MTVDGRLRVAGDSLLRPSWAPATQPSQGYQWTNELFPREGVWKVRAIAVDTAFSTRYHGWER